MVATYEQTKKGLSYFYPKRQVQDDGIYTKPLNCKLVVIWLYEAVINIIHVLSLILFPKNVIFYSKFR